MASKRAAEYLRRRIWVGGGYWSRRFHLGVPCTGLPVADVGTVGVGSGGWSSGNGPTGGTWVHVRKLVCDKASSSKGDGGTNHSWGRMMRAGIGGGSKARQSEWPACSSSASLCSLSRRQWRGGQRGIMMGWDPSLLSRDAHSERDERYGKVMSFGDGSQGALGHAEEELLNSFEPEEVRGLPMNIVNVGAGHYHSFAITGQGELWAWGRDAEHQLGMVGPGEEGSRPSDPSPASEEESTVADPEGKEDAGDEGGSPVGGGSVETKVVVEEKEEVEWDWSIPNRVKGLEGVRVVSAVGSGVASMAVGSDGSLWSWGSSRRGQLGLGDGVTQAKIPTRVEALRDQKVKQVACGWGHAVACTVEGEVFSWGMAADGRLGYGLGDGDGGGRDEENREKGGKGITHGAGMVVEAGGGGGIGGEEGRGGGGGEVTEAEVMRQVEREVKEEMEKEGAMEIVWEPRRVEAVSGRKVVAVACGMDHTLLLTEDGSILSFGDDSLHQLGRAMPSSPKDDKVRDVVGLVEGLERHVAVGIAAGLGHSLALARAIIANGGGPEGVEGGEGSVSDMAAEEGGGEDKKRDRPLRQVFSWGWNGGCQLGLQSRGKGEGEGGSVDRAMEVEGLSGEDVAMIACGRVHSVAVGDDGRLWSWGSGTTGRLGVGSTTEEPEPLWVEKVNGEVLAVACGFDHTLVLVST